MSKEVTKIGKKALNRIVIGIEFMVIFGLVGGLAIFLLGVPLTGDVQDLATGIETIDEDPVSALGIIFWFAVSTILIAIIATFIVVKFRLIPFRSVDKAPDVPKKTFVITFVILGAIISFLFWLTNQFLGFFGTQLSAVDIVRIGEAVVSGDLNTLFLGLSFALIAGTVIVFVVNRTSKIQKAEEDVGIAKI